MEIASGSYLALIHPKPILANDVPLELYFMLGKLISLALDVMVVLS